MAWFILFAEYMRAFASKENVYKSFAQMPMSLRRKPDDEGNMWEVYSTPIEVVLKKTANHSRRSAAEVAIGNVKQVYPRAISGFFSWKREFKRRCDANLDQSAVHEAQTMMETHLEEIMECQKRHADARDILNNTTSTLYRIPVESLDGMRDYDLTLTVDAETIYPLETPPLDEPDLESDYSPGETQGHAARMRAEVGA